MAKKFEPQTPIEQAVYKADRKALLEVVRGMSAAERAEERASVARMRKMIEAARYATKADNFKGWGSPSTNDQLSVVATASILCGTAEDVADSWFDSDELMALAREFPLPSLPALATALVKSRAWQARADTVHKLISAGLSPRPDCDEYVMGLMLLFQHRMKAQTTPAELFAADPGLKDVLLRILEVEGTQDVSLASVDKYLKRGGKSWAQRLVELSEQGVYTRAELIDKALSALERGWIQYRSGWFSAFHELLAPTVKEMRPHAPRYLALLASRIPPTVTFALNCVDELEAAGELARSKVLAALPPVFGSAVKGQIAAALKLLDRCVKAEPASAADAARLIVPALAHENAQVQASVLKRLGDWSASESLGAALGSYTTGIAAVNRDAFRKLMGKSAAPAPMPKPAKASAAAATREIVSPLDDRFALKPVATLDEAIELTAYSLENDTDIEALERAIAGLVRFAPFSTETRGRFAALAKRATKARKPMSHQLGRLVIFLTTGVRFNSGHFQDHGGHRNEVQLSLGDRLDDLMDFVAAGAGAPVLAEPTHRRGFIDPSALVRRLVAQRAKQHSTGQRDFLTALMRLAPPENAGALAAARKLDDDAIARALRHALGDDVKVSGAELADAARRMRDVLSGKKPPAREWKLQSEKLMSGKPFTRLNVDPPRSQDSKDPVTMLERLATSHKPRYLRDLAFTGCEDEGSIVYYASLLPAEPENFCAEGAAVIGDNLDWSEAAWQDKAYLRVLLEPTVSMGPMATLLLALGLAGKEPGQTAVAVDVLVATQLEGRLDAGLLASRIARLVAGGHTTCARYAKSLGAARRIDENVSPAIVEVVFAIVAAQPKEPPKDLGALLELVLEIVIGQEIGIPETGRAALERLEIGGKGVGLRKKLLSHT